MLFSLYYINLEKVYELRMIRNNYIQEKRVLENKIESNSHDMKKGYRIIYMTKIIIKRLLEFCIFQKKIF